jgi:hypothetical protein
MSKAIEGLQPKVVWKYFAEISRIPRGCPASRRRRLISDDAGVRPSWLVGVPVIQLPEAELDGR